MKRLTILLMVLLTGILFHSTVVLAVDTLTTIAKLSSSSDGAVPSARTASASKAVKRIGHVKEISIFALSGDGRLALTGDEDENNFIWDTASGALVREIGKPEAVRLRVVSAAFSPDTSQMIWARAGKIMPVIWDVESGRRLGVLSSKEKGHTAQVVATAFSPDGRYIATGDAQGTIVIWNRVSRSVVRRIKAHNGEARYVLFIPGKNELASAGSDGAVRLWGITGTELLATLLDPSGQAVTALTRSSDGQFLYAALEDMTVKGWTVALRSLRSTLDLNDRQINSIALSPDGDFMAVAEEDASVMLWNIRENRVAWKNELDGSITKVQFSPDGKRLYTAGGDNWVRAWDVASGQLQKKIGGVSE